MAAIKQVCCIASLLIAVVSGTDFRCPGNFTLIGQKCFQVTAERDTRFAGGINCLELESTAAVIENQEEMDALAAFLNTSVYLGIDDTIEENVFRSPTGVEVNYFNWNTGEPNNVRNEDCVVAKDNKEYRWNDVRCTKKFNTLCKRPAGMPFYRCQHGLNFDNSTCFYLSAIDNLRNFGEAMAECANLGMRLASIRSTEEQEFVQGLSEEKFDAWIGLNKQGGPFGSYVWLDNSITDYLNWAPTEPNNFSGNEYCAEINTSYDLGFQWNDEDCGKPTRFVCRGPTYEEVIYPKADSP